MYLATLHFSQCITNGIEPYLALFQAGEPLVIFQFEIPKKQ